MILEIGAILNGQIPRDFRHEIPARSIRWAQINLTENSSVFNENVIMVSYCLAILRKEGCKNGENTLFSNHHG